MPWCHFCHLTLNYSHHNLFELIKKSEVQIIFDLSCIKQMSPTCKEDGLYNIPLNFLFSFEKIFGVHLKHMKTRYQSFKGLTKPNSQVLYFANIKNWRFFLLQRWRSHFLHNLLPVMFTSPTPEQHL